MFDDQLNGVQLPSPVLTTYLPEASCDVVPHAGTTLTHTAGFFRNEDSRPGMRSAGSLTWAGVLNTHYWIDPAKGIASVFMAVGSAAAHFSASITAAVTTESAGTTRFTAP